MAASPTNLVRILHALRRRPGKRTAYSSSLAHVFTLDSTKNQQIEIVCYNLWLLIGFFSIKDMGFGTVC